MNIKRVKKMGVKNVGIAPKGLSDWAVTEKMSHKIKRERAQVEGVIGIAKSQKYGFNKPDSVNNEICNYRVRNIKLIHRNHAGQNK